MSQIDEDIAAIAAATQVYFDALHDGDADGLARVFLPSCALTQSVDGEIVITPRDAWLDAVRKRPSPRASGLARHDRILAIDRISGTLAHVKVACAMPPRHFIDILSFLKSRDGWKIAQKVFTTETRA
jgi:hypothetical protein